MRTRAIAIASFAATAGLALVVLPALPASAKGLSQSQINQLQSRLNNVKKITYQATYTQNESGKTTTITIAQAPGKSNFSTSDGSSIISTGKKTYFCSPNSGNSGGTGSSGSTGSTGNTGSTTTTTKAGSVQCITESGASPLLGLEQAFSPTALLNVLNEDKSVAVARALGIKVNVTSQTFAGQPSTCISATVHGQSGKYCVTNQGVLAYVGSNKNTVFQMTKFTTKPQSSLFTLPSGATTVTIPSIPNVSVPKGVTIPSVP